MKSIILSSNAFLVFILFLFSQRVTASSPYIPVTALDKFGNSVQLQNARQAAIRHGRLLVAAKFKESIVVVSVDTPKLGHLSPNKILEPVWSNSDTYLACTGIKTLLEFMGYNRQAELSDGISTPQEEKETTTWARPLGIQTLILTPSRPIVLVEPSGVSHEIVTRSSIGHYYHFTRAKGTIGGYNTATTPKKRGKAIAWRNYCTSHFQKWKSRIASVQARRGPVS